MLKELIPNFYFDRITDIDYKFLKENKIKGLLIDIDNTVMDDSKVLIDGIHEWLREMKSHKIKICFVSNTKSEDKKRIAMEMLESDVVIRAKKPFTKGFKKALRKMKLKANDTAVIGDQIFSDVLGGNILGAKTIFLKMVDPKEIMVVRIKRPFEKIILFFHKKLGDKIYNLIEFIYYGIFGVLTTVINFAVYAVMVCFNCNIILSVIVAWVLAIVFAYLTNRKLVFNSKAKGRKEITAEFFRFTLGRLLTLGVDVVGVWLMIDVFGIGKYISKLFMNIVIVILNFIMSKITIKTK